MWTMLAQMGEHEREEPLAMTAAGAAAQIVDAMQKRGFTISTKSGFMTNSPHDSQCGHQGDATTKGVILSCGGGPWIGCQLEGPLDSQGQGKSNSGKQESRKDLQAQAHQPQGQHVKVTVVATGKACDGKSWLFRKPKQTRIATR